MSARYPAGSVKENLLHLLAETEVAFGLWAAALILGGGGLRGSVHDAVAGVGLTVIDSATNPAGIGILQDAKVFEGEGISPRGLFLGALLPTAVAVVFF